MFHFTESVIFLSSKLKRKLDKMLEHIESEHELVALSVRNLVKLTEAFRLEQANELGIGPLAKLQDQILNDRERISRGDKPPTVEPSQTASGNVIAADDEILGPVPATGPLLAMGDITSSPA